MPKMSPQNTRRFLDLDLAQDLEHAGLLVPVNESAQELSNLLKGWGDPENFRELPTYLESAETYGLMGFTTPTARGLWQIYSAQDDTRNSHCIGRGVKA